MLAVVLITFVDIFVPIFSAILLLRVLLSYIVSPGNRFMEFLVQITEPLLAPIRKVLPSSGGLDFAPLALLLLLQLVQTVVQGLLPH